MEQRLAKIIADPQTHGCWLATLSFLELCGAKKIASSLSASLHHGEAWVKESRVLQHASEEFRHAYYFHKQIAKLSILPTTSFVQLGGRVAVRYLQRLDLMIARMLRQNQYSDIAKGCYLLTTYAIEKRAESVYGTYEKLLRAQNSPISIASILREECGHLQQIEEEIAQETLLVRGKDDACAYEQQIFIDFCTALPCG